MEEPVKINILLLPTALMKPGSICGIVHVRQLRSNFSGFLTIKSVLFLRFMLLCETRYFVTAKTDTISIKVL